METHTPARVLTMPGRRRWSRADYYRLGELGFFDGQRVELIGGQIIEMTPEGPRHAALSEIVRRALEAVFPPGRYHVRSAKPLALGSWDEPEPDAAVVEGEPRDYLGTHPTGAVLVVEVSDTTLAYDRGEKADLYAAAGVADYWIVSPRERIVEVCRQAAPHADSKTGYRYAERRYLTSGETMAPLAAPDRLVPVAGLLP